MSKKQITDKYSYENYTKKHVVVSKKGLIIGSICAGVVALGAGGAAIYLGVTRGTKDNSISFAEANEFAIKNYTLSKSDVEDNHKADATSAIFSWDFSKTNNLTKEGTGEKEIFDVFWSNNVETTPGSYINEIRFFNKMITPTKLSELRTKKEAKSNTDSTLESVYKFDKTKRSDKTATIFDSVTYFTKYIDKDDKTIYFFTDETSNLKKNGDEISCDYHYVFLKQMTGFETNTTVTVTYNKNGTVKKMNMPIYGYMKIPQQVGGSGKQGLINGSLTIDFKY